MSAVVLRRARQVGPALVDQVLSSGTQFLAVILIAQVSSAALFGTASAVLILQGLLLGTVRVLVGDITLLRCRRVGADVPREANLGVGLAGGLGLLLAVGLFIAGFVAEGDLGELLLVIAVTMPFGCVQDVLRSVAYGRERVMDAVWLDAGWMSVQVALSVALFATDRATAPSLMVAWGAGAFVSGVAGLLGGRRRPALAGFTRWRAEDGPRALGFLADYAVNSGVLLVAQLALGLIMPLGEFGTLRLARVAMLPLLNLVTGVRSLMLGRLAESEQEPSAARSIAVRVGWAFGIAMFAYGLVVRFMPVAWGEVVFGPNWADARALVGVIAVGEVFRFAATPAVDVVRVFGTPRQLVRTRLWTSMALAAMNLGAGAVAGAEGVVWGSLVVVLVSARIWWRLALRLTAPAPTLT